MSPAPDSSAALPLGPKELPANTRRQAVSTIRGYIYQFWWSVDAWLKLSSPDETIYLEGAEDLDTVGTLRALTEQVKNEAAAISLNNQRAHTALENFWTLCEAETSRRVEFHYISTAAAANEQDADFGGVNGIAAWKIARTDVQKAAAIQTYLLGKIPATSALHAFLSTATAEDVQAKLIQRFHWFLEQSGIDGVIKSIDDRLTILLSQKNIPLPYVTHARDRLYAHVSDVITQANSADRRLTAAELIRQIATATTAHLAIPAHQLSASNNGQPDLGLELLRHMRIPTPKVPSPLLSRPAVLSEVNSCITASKAVLLVGSVFKGKTTIAQLVANELCPQAWWYPASTRKATETDSLFKAIAAGIVSPDAPSLVVVDDIDISPIAHSAYGQSLAFLVERARQAGRGLLLTARGTTTGLAQLADFQGIETINVPEMSLAEVQAHCLENGCPAQNSDSWGKMIRATTGGHPKLVQVRICELRDMGWPSPSLTQLVAESQAVTTARDFARQLLSASVPPATAEFLYTASEAATPLARAMLLHLTSEMAGMVNGGDVVDNLAGKWLELVESDRYRVTPILKGAAAKTWTPAAHKLAHGRLYDAISGNKSLSDIEAAALLFHAYFAEDSAQLMHCASVLLRIESQDVLSAVYQNLLWVPQVSLSPGERFFKPQPFVSTILRQIQFAVANEQGSDSVPNVLERWSEEIQGLENQERKEALQVVQWSALLTNRNNRIPLRRKLYSVEALSSATGEMADNARQNTLQAMEFSRVSPGGIPDDASTRQFLLMMHAASVRSPEDLASFLDWLEHDASDATRGDLEAVLSWPMVDSCGGYIHGAWSSRHELTTDWAPILKELQRAFEVALKFKLPKYGSEAARALAIVNCEHLNDKTTAWGILEAAAKVFGDNATLREQRSNIHFQSNEDAASLDVWRPLFADSTQLRSVDAFAFRRAGISACRLGLWDEAERYFLGGIHSAAAHGLKNTETGLGIDASYAIALGGNPQRAARLLSDTLLDLPNEAYEDGNQNWSSLLRVVMSVIVEIEGCAKDVPEQAKSFLFGKASEPGLNFGNASEGQHTRTVATLSQACLTASILGSVGSDYRTKMTAVRGSKLPLLRFYASKAHLTLELQLGPSSQFPEALAAYERSCAAWLALSPADAELTVDAGDVEPAELVTHESGWFAVFSAALLCCESPQDMVEAWKDATQRRWGATSQVMADLNDVSIGLSRNVQQAKAILRDASETPRGEIFGATLALTRATQHSPEALYALQVTLTSAIVSSQEGMMLQSTFSHVVARRLAEAWRQYAHAPFLFSTPRVTLPMLQNEILAVSSGKAGVKRLLNATAQAVGTSLSDDLQSALT